MDTIVKIFLYAIAILFVLTIVAIVVGSVRRRVFGSKGEKRQNYVEHEDPDKETDALCKTLSVEELYEKACALTDEDGIASDYYRWERFMKTAADKGYIPAVREWGDYNIGKDNALGLQLIIHAADAGDDKAVEKLFELYYYGSHGGSPKIEKDREKAAKFIMPYANDGSAVAQRLLGSYYQYEKDDDEKALEWYLKAADGGDAEAMVEAADMYSFTDDFEAEKKLLLKAAEQNYAEAEINLGIFYHSIQTEDETFDYEKSMYWYKRAFEHGKELAGCYVGEMYLNGEGVAKDEYQAFEWFKKAYEKGSLYGTYLYGKCFMEGIGVSQDKQKGIELYTEAAGFEDHAQCALGLCYFEGNGVKKDKERARELWTKAADDNDEAKELLKTHFGI